MLPKLPLHRLRLGRPAVLRRQLATCHPSYNPSSPLVCPFFEEQTGTWQYVVSDPLTREAALIDTVLDYDPASGTVSTKSAEKLLKFVNTNGFTVRYILETHAHADHLTAAQFFKKELAAPVGIGEGITAVQAVFAKRYGLRPTAFNGAFDLLLQDGQELTLGTLKLRVLALPGHTPDHLGFMVGDCVFAGDSIFLPDIGSARADFPGGDAQALYSSMQRLMALLPGTRLYTGHDYPPADRQARCVSTVSQQKESNKHAKEGVSEADFVAFRSERDSQLSAPRLLHPSLQTNLCGGRLPRDENGTLSFRIPINNITLKIKSLDVADSWLPPPSRHAGFRYVDQELLRGPSPPMSPTTKPSVELPTTKSSVELSSNTPTKPAAARRISLRASSPSPKTQAHKTALSEGREHEKKANAAQAFTKRLVMPLSANTEKRAKESAMILRTLIVGPSDDYAAPKLSKAVARPQMSKVKSELMQPNSANKVIAQLRALPVLDENAKNRPSGPIHAVCLAHPDAEEHALHFSKLDEDNSDKAILLPAPLDKLVVAFNEMQVVDLVAAPDLGLGQPPNGKGLLAGAVPTAGAVLNGFQQITPQLMALGYATGKAILPDHKGVHPPTDRMSVLTYWWGLEVVLPPPTLEYLSNTKSIAGTLVNFLTALSLVNNGVREILPFVRYISQFIDFEFGLIKAQDRGQGVVCASTWIMPAALVPRPWDFTAPDSTSKKDAGIKDAPTTPAVLLPSTPVFVETESSPKESNTSPEMNTSSEPNTDAPASAAVAPAPEPTTTTIPPAPRSRLIPPTVFHTSKQVLTPGLAMT
ncbi:Lactamase-B domain-containing protein [Mycena kentingensis (nom. inval.)]|nr:Lactamase-B domain-containing protein [Mycena kentingensis (nom. inval.)]